MATVELQDGQYVKRHLDHIRKKQDPVQSYETVDEAVVMDDEIRSLQSTMLDAGQSTDEVQRAASGQSMPTRESSVEPAAGPGEFGVDFQPSTSSVPVDTPVVEGPAAAATSATATAAKVASGIMIRRSQRTTQSHTPARFRPVQRLCC